MTPPEVEAFYKIDKLRREIDSLARRSVLQLVGALVVAFVLGWAIGRFSRGGKRWRGAFAR